MIKQDIENRIEQQEILGREQFSYVCNREPWCKVNRFSKERMARWDVSFWINKTPIIADIKKRRYTSDTFVDWYFEVDKAKELIKMAEESEKKTGLKTKIGYIHLFTDNIMWLWTFTVEELKTLVPIWVEIQKNDWSDEKVKKLVYGLNNAQASIKEEINLNTSIFIIQ